MRAMGSGTKGARVPSWGEWLEHAPLSGTLAWWASPVCYYYSQVAPRGSHLLTQRAAWPPTPCYAVLLIYSLEAGQPWSTAAQHVSTSEEPSQAPTASHCCCLKSADPPLRKMACVQNLMGEVVTHALLSVPNSCSLSVP